MTTYANPTDHCGFYIESASERTERFATLAGMFAAPDVSFDEAVAEAVAANMERMLDADARRDAGILWNLR